MRDLPYHLSTVRLSYVLLAILIPIGELHKIWEGDSRSYDIFILLDYELPLPWIVRFASTQAQFLIISYVLMVFGRKYGAPKSLRDIFVAVFVYCWVDVILYFIAFGFSYWSWGYYFLATFMVWANNHKSKKGTVVD